MQLQEILNDSQTETNTSPPPSESEQTTSPVKLSDFLQYPTMNSEPVSPGKEVTLTQVTMPDFPPAVADIIARLKDSTVTMEVLEVFHDLYRMTGTKQLVIDIEVPDDWPDFYEEWMGLNDAESSE